MNINTHTRAYLHILRITNGHIYVYSIDIQIAY